LAGLEEPLLASYNYGSESTSDLTIAFLALSSYTHLRLHLGVPLRYVEEELNRWCRQMTAFQAMQMRRVHTIRRQYVLNLLGQSDDPVVLTGESMDGEIFLAWSCTEGDDTVVCALYVD
jgi:hypothetical protein